MLLVNPKKCSGKHNRAICAGGANCCTGELFRRPSWQSGQRHSLIDMVIFADTVVSPVVKWAVFVRQPRPALLVVGAHVVQRLRGKLSDSQAPLVNGVQFVRHDV